ncbi:MAG: ABC transporter ATP-binding protein/permease [Coriobacteriaceae bacterium]|nr:ABC transporter ATP-binding protein/permease [Coriobacteriaceae bacterium]
MIELKDIRKSYKVADFQQTALDGVSLAFRDSEFVAVLGPSGSGKTTLLNILGGLDHADSGDIVINGVSTSRYKDADWDTYRNHRIGFIFQSYNLIPHQTILANVELALTLSGVDSEERKERATRALERVGLGEHVDKKPNQLSGGQMQRVAIARALINDPDIVLADEPTGALDTETGIQVMDLLSEIAQDRLVIMVTHNPELAERYASRIVRLADGRITDDSAPLSASEGVQLAEREDDAGAAAESDADPSVRAYSDEEVQAELDRDAAKGRKKHSSMSFMTALSLSFNNLMTKKGRTFLTAFAGSIGIIGIAAILALSNGVSNYIDKTESEAMSSFPLTISKSSFDMTKLMTMQMSETDESQDPSGKGNIKQVSVMTDMFAEVKNNDLSAFKDYIENDGSDLKDYTSAIQYYYDIDPLIYSSDTSEGIHQLSPSNLDSMLMPGAAQSSFSVGSASTSVFQQMIDDEDLIRSQVDVVAGEWPDSYDEALLVLSSGGVLTDYTLYGLDVYDFTALEPMFRDVLEGKEVQLSGEHIDFSYEDALGMTFRVLSPSETYQKNEEQGSWTDMSDDSEFMKDRIANGVELKIVGVVQPKEGSDMTLLSEGVAYKGDLVRHLSNQAEQSQIVQEQMADPERDVFTGKTFEELESEEGSAFDMENVFSVDEAALAGAFSFDSSALEGVGAGFDASSIDMSGMGSIDTSNLEVDTGAVSSMFSNEALQQIIAGAPQFTLDGSGTAGEGGLTEEQQQAISDANVQLAGGFSAYLASLDPSILMDPNTDFNALYQDYMASGGQAIVDQLGEDLQAGTQAMVEAAMQNYLTNQFAPYLSASLSAMMEQAAGVMANQMAEAMTTQLAAMTDSLGSTLQSAISGQLQSSMEGLSSAMSSGFSFDADAFANAIQFNMTEEDLASLITNYMNAEELTYEKNLSKLGYADEANPSSIALYPTDFVAKDKVVECIDDYNAKAEEAGEKERTIEYSDIAGVLMSSVNNIVDMISMVLIAFVSISLVVSSIMIGIITYISVLERKKEIGILRAMGASKGNIANVFNAETIIEGLMAGVFAIAVVMLVSLPVNAIVANALGVQGILALPWSSAIILVCISVVLTFVAGLIPSTAASRRDPVEALRSE